MNYNDNKNSGMNSSNNNENNYNTEYARQVQTTAEQKTSKTISFILSLAVACLIFGMISLFSTMESKIDNLQNQISILSSQINTQQNNVYNEDIYSEFDYEFISISNEEEANIINTKFSYSPDTYPKNAFVYLSIINRDKTVQKLDMQLNDGVFTATTDIDVTSPPKSIYVYIDDGDVITRKTAEEFFEIMPFDFISFEKKSDGFNNMQMIQWESNQNSTFQIREIYYVAEKDLKEIQSPKLTIDEYTDENFNEYCTVSFDDSMLSETDNSDLTFAERYIKAIDQNGIIYKFNIETEQYKITFPNDKSIKNYD